VKEDIIIPFSHVIGRIHGEEECTQIAQHTTWLTAEVTIVTRRMFNTFMKIIDCEPCLLLYT
jgi:hypothetical protein